MRLSGFAAALWVLSATLGYAQEVTDREAAYACEAALDRQAQDPGYLGVRAECALAMHRNLPVGVYVQQRTQLYAAQSPEAIAASLAQLEALAATDGRAALEVAKIYHSGSLVPRNAEKAFVFAQMAFNNRWLSPSNRHQAMYLMAEFYLNGDGVALDQNEGLRLMVHAADLGDPAAGAWLSAHPEVNAETVRNNYIYHTTIPQNQYKKTISDADGRPVEVDFRAGMNERLADYYPERALDNEVGGEVVLECRYTFAGRLDNCLVLSERPAGYGFSDAAYRGFIRYFRLPTGQEKAFHQYLNGRALRFALRWSLE